jgi:hypothetical protein
MNGGADLPPSLSFGGLAVDVAEAVRPADGAIAAGQSASSFVPQDSRRIHPRRPISG